MDSYKHLSIPEFYQYRPYSVITDVMYAISPECTCVSDEKFEREILASITTDDKQKNCNSTTRKKRGTNSKMMTKPILKIY